VAAAVGRLELAGGTRGGVGDGGGTPNLGGERSPGELAGPQDPRQTGALGPTETEHRTDDAKHRAGDASRDRERVGNHGARGTAGTGAMGVARTRGRWPTSAQAAALCARSVRGGGTPEVVADGVGAGGQWWHEIEEHEWPEGIAEGPAVREARILGDRRSVRVWRDGRAFRVRLGLAGTRMFEEQIKKV